MTEQFDCLDGLNGTVRTHTRARVVLGPCSPVQIESVLGLEPHTTPTPDVPPGRGYARLGTGPVLRIQVPTTPDPYDDATSEAQRQTVLGLLPERRRAIEATAPDPVLSQDRGRLRRHGVRGRQRLTATEVREGPRTR